MDPEHPVGVQWLDSSRGPWISEPGPAGFIHRVYLYHKIIENNYRDREMISKLSSRSRDQWCGRAGEWPLALLHPRSWSLGGDGHVVKRMRHSIFPENYVPRSRGRPPAPGGEPASALEPEPEPAGGGGGGECQAEYGHEWFFYPAMTVDEALLFVNFDSDAVAPQFVMHGAFDEEPGPAHVELGGEVVPPVRVSIEVRLLVIIRRGVAGEL
jgi:hypothetical protein